MQHNNHRKKNALIALLICAWMHCPSEANHYRTLYQILFDHFSTPEKQSNSLRIVAWDMLVTEDHRFNPHAGLSQATVLDYARIQGEDPISLEPLSHDPARLLALPYHTQKTHNCHSSNTNNYVYHLFDIDTFCKFIDRASASKDSIKEPFARDTIPNSIQSRIYAYCDHRPSAHRIAAPTSQDPGMWELLLLLGYAFRF